MTQALSGLTELWGPEETGRAARDAAIEAQEERYRRAAQLREERGWRRYNENDRFATAWLRNLIAAGHLPAGDVDERSIVDVRSSDLNGYTQCHFFAGIGGWAYALNLAEWGDRSVWTGSCPCQPFSSAGRQGGALDERHLWPQWFRLIRECHPDTIFGEQVEGAVGFGWIDRVFADLEAEGYACGAAVLGAHSVGAPHIRQRLFWVAHSAVSGEREHAGSQYRQAGAQPESGRAAAAIGLGGNGATRWMADAEGQQLDGDGDTGRRRRQSANDSGLGNATRGEMGRARQPWQDSVWLPCLDGKARRVESTIQPLAHGISNRVGLLRGSGNAIVPQVAAKFIGAFLDARRQRKPT